MKNNTNNNVAVRSNVSVLQLGNETINVFPVSNEQGFRLEDANGSIFVSNALVAALGSVLSASVPTAQATKAPRTPKAQAQKAPETTDTPKRKRGRPSKAEVAARNGETLPQAQKSTGKRRGRPTNAERDARLAAEATQETAVTETVVELDQDDTVMYSREVE